MTAILFPVLLILVALAVILVLFGRHLPDVARGIKERKKEQDLGPVDELPVSPRNRGLTKPTGGFLSSKTSKFKKFFGFLIKGVVFVFRKIVLALGFLWKKILTVFHRVPRVRPSATMFKRQKGELTDDFEEKNLIENRFSTLTTDIKIMPKNPLRYPEPIPERQGKGKKKTEIKKQLEQKKEIDVDVSETKSKKEDISFEDMSNESVVNVEKTREIRTKSRRRLIGKVTTKPSFAPEKGLLDDDSVSNNLGSNENVSSDYERQPSVPLEAKKVSFIDRESVALWDSTQEIGKMIQEGNYGRAESELIDILSKNPRNTEAYRLLGIVYLKRKDFTQAREVFEEALRRDPEYGGLQGPLGFCYMSMGEYGKALAMYQQALNMDEDNIEYLEQLLVISARMDRRPLVKMVAKKILALNPHHTEAKKYLERITV